MPIKIYTKILSLAEMKGISIHRLEEQAGLSNGAVSKWKKSKPSFYSILKISEALGVTVDYFVEQLNEEGEKKHDK